MEPPIVRHIADLFTDFLPYRDDNTYDYLQMVGTYEGWFKQKIIYNDYLAKFNFTILNTTTTHILLKSGERHISLGRAILSALNDLDVNRNRETFFSPDTFENWKEVFFDVTFLFYTDKKKPIIYTIQSTQKSQSHNFLLSSYFLMSSQIPKEFLLILHGILNNFMLGVRCLFVLIN